MSNKSAAIELCEQYSFGARQFHQVQLEKVNLEGAFLSQIDLSNADLRESCLVQANLSRANLSGVNFADANLSRANLTGANIYRANFAGANLNRANLSATKLVETNTTKDVQNNSLLDTVNSIKVDFRWANLTGAFFIGVNLNMANLGGSIYDDDTNIPPGFDPASVGMVHIKMIQNCTLDELLAQFNHLYSYSSKYIGRIIATKYFHSSRPNFDWLNQFEINNSNQIVFQGTVSSFISPEKLYWFQEWMNSFTKSCSSIIKDFPTLAKLS